MKDFETTMTAVGLPPVFIDENTDFSTLRLGGWKQPETNTEFVTRVMDFCPTGALSQMFIIEAIDRYAKAVAAAPVSDTNGLIDMGAWKRTAEFLVAEMDKKYNFKGN